MALSSHILFDKANNAFNTTTLTAIVSAQNCAAIDASLKIYKVSTFADLPNPVLNTGRMIFVESLNKYLYSNGIEWTDNIESPSLILWTWGYNNSGELGSGILSTRYSPGTTAGGGTNWNQVSCGDSYTAGIKTDGTLWTWGNNTNGTLGTGNTTWRSSPDTIAGGGNDWIQVSCGNNHSAAIKTDGKLWVWGLNSYGQLGNGNSSTQNSPVTTAGGGTNWNQVSCGKEYTAAIKTDGKLWTWGNSSDGRLGINPFTGMSSPITPYGGGTNWSQVSCGESHTMAIKTDGTLWVWGRNNYGQLGTNDITNRSSPVTVSGGGTNWNQVDNGAGFTAAIKTDGTLWTWGRNNYGKLGDNTTTSRRTPVTTAGGGNNWSYVSSGWNHTIATKTDGTLWSWGYNYFGRLGDGTTASKSSPITVVGSVTTWSIINAGGNHTAAIG